MARREPPPHVRSLNQRIRNLAGGESPEDKQRLELRLRRAIANVVVSQMLPDGVVKGGTAMKLRIGEAGSRFTPDFDAARSRPVDLDDYLDALDDRLAAGWGGFTGRVVEDDPAEPEGVPDDYIMRPFDLKLDYEGRSWLTVRFELGHDEVGSTASPDAAMSNEMRELFVKLGLPDPQPAPLLPVAHQVAQKLHACTGVTGDGTNERAHDLVDLQLLDEEETINLVETSQVARRLFVARKSHPWPPQVVVHPGWPELYDEAAEGLGVLPTVEEAAAWTNRLIERLDEAG